VHGICCKRWPTGKPTPRFWPQLADKKLRATPAQLCDALGACTELHPVYRRLLKMVLEELQFLEQEIVKLDQEMASLRCEHQEAVQRLAAVPGVGWIRRSRSLLKWVPKLRRLLRPRTCRPGWARALEMTRVRSIQEPPLPERATVICGAFSIQCANAAVKTKGSIFEMVYRRLVLRLGTQAGHWGNCPSALSADLDHLLKATCRYRGFFRALIETKYALCLVATEG
jgi:hypothetical protein